MSRQQQISETVSKIEQLNFRQARLLSDGAEVQIILSIMDTMKAVLQDPHLLGVVGATTLMLLMDLIVCNFLKSYKVARWKILHATANLFVTVLSARDFWATLRDPAGSCTGTHNIAVYFLLLKNKYWYNCS